MFITLNPVVIKITNPKNDTKAMNNPRIDRDIDMKAYLTPIASVICEKYSNLIKPMQIIANPVTPDSIVDRIAKDFNAKNGSCLHILIIYFWEIFNFDKLSLEM